MTITSETALAPERTKPKHIEVLRNFCGLDLFGLISHMIPVKRVVTYECKVRVQWHSKCLRICRVTRLLLLSPPAGFSGAGWCKSTADDCVTWLYISTYPRASNFYPTFMHQNHTKRMMLWSIGLHVGPSSAAAAATARRSIDARG